MCVIVSFLLFPTYKVLCLSPNGGTLSAFQNHWILSPPWFPKFQASTTRTPRPTTARYNIEDTIVLTAFLSQSLSSRNDHATDRRNKPPLDRRKRTPTRRQPIQLPSHNSRAREPSSSMRNPMPTNLPASIHYYYFRTPTTTTKAPSITSSSQTDHSKIKLFNKTQLQLKTHQLIHRHRHHEIL